MPVVETAVVHRHGEEARGPEGLDGGVVLLEVAAERLAAVVDTEHHLRGAGVDRTLALEVRPAPGARAWDAPRC